MSLDIDLLERELEPIDDYNASCSNGNYKTAAETIVHLIEACEDDSKKSYFRFIRADALVKHAESNDLKFKDNERKDVYTGALTELLRVIGSELSEKAKKYHDGVCFELANLSDGIDEKITYFEKVESYVYSRFKLCELYAKKEDWVIAGGYAINLIEDGHSEEGVEAVLTKSIEKYVSNGELQGLCDYAKKLSGMDGKFESLFRTSVDNISNGCISDSYDKLSKLVHIVLSPPLFESEESPDHLSPPFNLILQAQLETTKDYCLERTKEKDWDKATDLALEFLGVCYDQELIFPIAKYFESQLAKGDTHIFNSYFDGLSTYKGESKLINPIKNALRSAVYLLDKKNSKIEKEREDLIDILDSNVGISMGRSKYDEEQEKIVFEKMAELLKNGEEIEFEFVMPEKKDVKEHLSSMKNIADIVQDAAGPLYLAKINKAKEHFEKEDYAGAISEYDLIFEKASSSNHFLSNNSISDKIKQIFVLGGHLPNYLFSAYVISGNENSKMTIDETRKQTLKIHDEFQEKEFNGQFMSSKNLSDMVLKTWEARDGGIKLKSKKKRVQHFGYDPLNINSDDKLFRKIKAAIGGLINAK